MSILIKGMEIPKSRPVCIVIDVAGQARRYDLNNDKYADDKLFEAVPVPPHGRLIDADALVDSFDPSDFWNPDAEDNCFAAIHVVNCAPTILEAEEGE